MLQLLEALSFAHERNIAHLDIKVRMVTKDFYQYRRKTGFRACFIRLKSAIKLIVIKLERKFRLDLEWFNQIGILFQPQNIVLMSEFPNCEIKLCDLEVSRVIQDHEEIREIIGTPDYVGMLS